MRKIVNQLLIFIAVVFVVYVAYLMWKSREKFGVPEFIDRTNQDRTAMLWDSSYEQRTNHQPPFDSGRTLVGQSTGHRVNLWEGHRESSSSLL